MTCSLTSKDITIVNGYIPPSGISLPNRQSAKPLDPVSTKSGEGHFGEYLAARTILKPVTAERHVAEQGSKGHLSICLAG